METEKFQLSQRNIHPFSSLKMYSLVFEKSNVLRSKLSRQMARNDWFQKIYIRENVGKMRLADKLKFKEEKGKEYWVELGGKKMIPDRFILFNHRNDFELLTINFNKMYFSGKVWFCFISKIFPLLYLPEVEWIWDVLYHKFYLNCSGEELRFK